MRCDLLGSYTFYNADYSLQRYIAFIPTMAFGVTLQASWESVAVSFQAGLYNGGPVWIKKTRNEKMRLC
jgi:hypothetical protein